MAISVTPHLWFDKEALEAAEFYCSVFPDSRIHQTRHFDNAGPSGHDTASTVDFEINGQRVIALNAGPHFKLDEAFSFFVLCDTQEEVDLYWDRLTADGGEEVQCGWLKDRFGVSWQIVPKLLDELLQDPDKERSNAVMQAMLKMKKLDCAALQAAYDQPVGV